MKRGIKMANFCGKCGNRLNEKTGLCPVCDERYNSTSVSPEKQTTKNPKKKKHIFLKIISIILAFCVLVASLITVSYFGVINIPVVNNWLESVGLKENDGYNSVFGKFTDINIVDEESAISAIQEIADDFGWKNAADELEIINTSNVNDISYYRCQQMYKGYPVYGREMVVIASSDGEAKGISANVTDIPTDIDIKSSVSSKKIEKSLKEHYDTEKLDIGTIDEENLCIYFYKNRYYKAYNLLVKVNGETWRVFINAENAEFIDSLCMTFTDNENIFNPLKSAECVSEDGTQKFTGIYDVTKEEYIMISPKYLFNTLGLGVSVSSYKNNNSKKDGAESTLISSNDNVFGNTEYERSLNPNKAIIYFNNILDIRNYFDAEYAIVIEPFCYYDDAWDSGKNGYAEKANIYSSGSSRPTTIYVISIGSKYSMTEIDLLAHEYMHTVEMDNVGMTYKNETGAIMEGYSDIFGEILECKLSNSEKPDWIHNNGRNIENPSNTKNPDSLKSKYYKKSNWFNNEDNGFVHKNSTIVSHTAFLMCDGDNEDGYLSVEQLSDLWFNAMLTLPKDCSFSILRTHIQEMAKILCYTPAQQTIISSAFDTVGIEAADIDYSITSKETISNEEAYNSYCQAVQKTYSSGSWHEDMDMNIKMQLSDEKSVQKNTVHGNSSLDIKGYSPYNQTDMTIDGYALATMGNTTLYDYDVSYSNGKAYYDYRQPNQQSVEIEIDSMYFNMSSITSEMIVKSAMPNNYTINLTVDSGAMKELSMGFAQDALDTAGAENLKYGNVDFSVALDKNTGAVSLLTLTFSATMNIQGYSVKADYYIKYSFDIEESAVNNIKENTSDEKTDNKEQFDDTDIDSEKEQEITVNSQNSTTETDGPSSRTLIVGISPDYEPFGYYENGELTGFDVDLIKLIANELGYEIEFKIYSFENLVSAVYTGDVDLAISAIAITEERKKSIDFTNVYISEIYYEHEGGQIESSYAIALPKNCNGFKASLNEEIKRLKENGEIQKLVNKYHIY